MVVSSQVQRWDSNNRFKGPTSFCPDEAEVMYKYKLVQNFSSISKYHLWLEMTKMCINYVYFFGKIVRYYVLPNKIHIFNNTSYFSKDFNK